MRNIQITYLAPSEPEKKEEKASRKTAAVCGILCSASFLQREPEENQIQWILSVLWEMPSRIDPVVKAHD
jgi:hypothetical protein